MANKKSVVRTILIGAVAVVAILAVVIQLQPEDYRVERSALINADAAIIFPHVNDLQLWNAWSPFAKMDPDAAVSFSGPQAGQDAAMSWKSDITGAGTMTVIESVPNDHVTFRLDFTKPLAGTAEAQFTFEPQGTQGTNVTWAMYGKNDFIGKAMSLVMDCEAMMGPEFEKGLASLKQVAEAQAAAPVVETPAPSTEAPVTETAPGTETPAAETSATDVTTPPEEIAPVEDEATPDPDVITEPEAEATPAPDAATEAAPTTEAPGTEPPAAEAPATR